ncbi:conserved Plasmodium protein, unknown function [Plasmodium berghei]|uniref:Uncharacterized protein n=2 Tax=Plasmodium berghei TaxID=5821 RepID=A0A509AUB6_PLABA|nr:conserved Plasmodium protein, unknown function [Plasmodium berghei ANKA]CXJ29606.1 conserved Plasmodium protein, unknown function [Plasmodium berghei]SCM27088.1 conserved Plasmodium protein, unknown function [Plasmodium berghei]SCN28814.1 conserved Plasmodium protein, unknown function [Plasmodium berghei]SCO63114.1 conserved Plasmodium protein, unknown function [Plasmodium berghei]SCO64561.1 conserved Plasmodium protein, unknown function [Plasmodium berghei]|eukprot:XP_034424460.1 conserved Plasmodium protein, unknown function [Plasmodium berghei ANKA]
MERHGKRTRASLGVLLDERYKNREKENEIKLFENIKTDISIIISEQLKKRSKSEFELTTIEKKYIYLKYMTEELEKIIKSEDNELKNEEEIIKNYFEYTSTNLDYIFIKYKSIVTDLSEQNNNMKLKLKEVKENEINEFRECYEIIKKKNEKLKEYKNSIIDIKNKLCDLKKEYEYLIKDIKIKSEEKDNIEKNYKELLRNIEHYKKEFENIKECCNLKMSEKKETSINLNIIEKDINDINNEIDKLLVEKKKITNELSDLEEDNNNILKKLFDFNSNLNEKNNKLSEEICEIENKINEVKNKKEMNEYNYAQVELKLKEVTKICENKKKEDEEISEIVKEASEAIISNINIFKEKEKESVNCQNEYNIIKENNLDKINRCNLLNKKIEHGDISINNCKCNIEKLKTELINIDEIKEKNEKKKCELLSLIEISEKLLQDEKNNFFKISKFFNLISASNDEYIKLQNKKNDKYCDNSVIKKYKELENNLKTLCKEINEKKNLIDHVIQNDINNIKNTIENFEINLTSSKEENQNINDKLEILLNDYKSYEKELDANDTNYENKIKEISSDLDIKYEKLTETLASHLKTKHIEHNKFLKQGEKEKLEFNFQLYKSEVILQLEKEKEEKKKKIEEIRKELRVHQQKYASLKKV